MTRIGTWRDGRANLKRIGPGFGLEPLQLHGSVAAARSRRRPRADRAHWTQGRSLSESSDHPHTFHRHANAGLRVRLGVWRPPPSGLGFDLNRSRRLAGWPAGWLAGSAACPAAAAQTKQAWFVVQDRLGWAFRTRAASVRRAGPTGSSFARATGTHDDCCLSPRRDVSIAPVTGG
jgi:hypothetical protein